MQTNTTKTKLGLRIVTKGEIDECLAVDRAQMHAQNKSLSWKQYIKNLDTFLGLEVEFDKFSEGADYR